MMRRNHIYPTFFTVLLLALVPLFLQSSGNRRLLIEQVVHLSPYVVSAVLGFLALRLNERPLFYFALLLGLECALLRESSAPWLRLSAHQSASAAALSYPFVLCALFYLVPMVAARWKSFLYPFVVWAPLTVMVLVFRNWKAAGPLMATDCFSISLVGFAVFTLSAPWLGSRLSREVRIFVATASLPIFWLLSQIIRKGLSGRELELAVPLSFLSSQFVVAAITFRLYWQKIYLDELTGLPNRRALNEALPVLKSPFCVAMFDVDHFKRFNDEHGHEQGDTVLRFLASVLEKEFGANIYRYGGEEFCALFEGQTIESVSKAVEHARSRVEAREFTIRKSGEHRKATSPKDRTTGHPKRQTFVTVSAGVATDDVSLRQPEDVLIAADAALYRAKQTGRNRVVIAEFDHRKREGGRAS